jgi:hypothetical protein
MQPRHQDADYNMNQGERSAKGRQLPKRKKEEKQQAEKTAAGTFSSVFQSPRPAD